MTHYPGENYDQKMEILVEDSQEVRIQKPIITLQKNSIEQDIYLDPNCKPNKEIKATTQLTNIFITGATGFVGTHILYELLHTTTATAYCLVRAQDNEAGKNKIKSSLQSYGLWSENFNERICPIIGDLGKTHFGLSAKAFEDLANIADHIYHCGALVNFILPYYLLKGPNVGGLQTVLELSCLKKTIPISYLSTYSVLFNDQNKQETTFKETPLSNHPEGLPLGYSQSKWVAEKIVEIAQGRNIPITTYRLGSISGDSETGIYNRKDFLTNFIDYCIKIQRLPKLDITVDMTPINYAAKAITELSQQGSKKSIYHITNPNPISWSQMTVGLTKIMPKLQEIAENEWLSYAIKYQIPDHPFTQYLPLLKQDGFSLSNICLSSNQRCDTTNTSTALTHMFCPSINKELMTTYLKGTAYSFPKRHVFSTPNTHTIATLNSILTSHQPILIQSFMHKPTARAAQLMNRLITKLSHTDETYKTFFANSRLEAIDGMIKLLRHNANKKNPGYTSIAIFESDATAKNLLSPFISSKHDLRPHIQWLSQQSEIPLAIQDPTTTAIILVISPMFSEYDLIEIAKLAHKHHTHLIFDISRMALAYLPKLPRKVDGIIFGENAVDYQIPCGGFSATDALLAVWNTADNCLLHTSTFGGNTFATSLLCESLANTLNIPQTERHYQSLRQKDVFRLYHQFINPKLATLLKMMGMTKSISYANGSLLKWNNKGQTVSTIDALGSFSSSLRGHNPSDISALLRQFDPQKNHWKELKETLLTLSGFDDAIPAVSGASAVEIALTTAMMANPSKPTILTFKNGFSGKTLVSLIGTAKEKYIKPFSPLYAHVVCLDPHSPDAVTQFIEAINNHPVGLVWFEVIQGEAGIKALPKILLEAIETHQKENGYLIGIDEIQTGLFRTGKFLNYEGKISRPDIVTIGKGLSDMACPIGAVLFKDHVLISAEKTNGNYTSSIKDYYANTLSSAISNHALEYAKANHLSENAKTIGNKIMDELRKLEGKTLIKQVRGEGLLIGIELKRTFPLTLPFVRDYVAALFAGCCLKQKKDSVLVAFTLNNPHTVRIAPSLTLTEDEADIIIKTVSKIAKYSPLKLLIKSIL